MLPYAHSNLIYNIQKLETCQMSLNRRIDKGNVGHLYNYNSAIQNNDFMKFTGKWIALENIILSEVTQVQKTHMVCTH